MPRAGGRRGQQESIDPERGEPSREEPATRSVLLLLTSRHGGRELVRTILRDSRDWMVAGDAGSREEAARLARRTHPDAILVAVDLEDGPLADLILELQEQSPQSRMVTIGETEEGVRQQELERQQKLSRLMWREVDTERLESTLKTAVLGYRVVSEDITPAPVEQPERPPAPPVAVTLTEDQRKVGASIRAGRTLPHIAKMMKKHRRTIDRRVRELKDIFGVSSQQELVDAMRDLDLGEPVPEG